MAKQQTLDNKAMCDSLMKSLSKKSSRAESEMASLGQINKYLTGIIEKQDKRILEFENSNDALQRYKHMVKCVTMMNCKGCDQVFTPSYFSSHTGVCSGLEGSMIEVKVMEAVRSSDTSQAHYDYKMWVSYGGTHWYVFKRYKQFVKLDEELRLTLTGINVEPLDV